MRFLGREPSMQSAAWPDGYCGHMTTRPKSWRSQTVYLAILLAENWMRRDNGGEFTQVLGGMGPQCSSACPDLGFFVDFPGIGTKLFGMVTQVGEQTLLLLLAPLSIRVLGSHVISQNGAREAFRRPLIH